jgi:hypothetical protein
MTNRRSRDIREIMSQTGMNYTKAALELDRRKREAVQSVSGMAHAPKSDMTGPMSHTAEDIAAAQQRWVEQYAHASEYAARMIADAARVAQVFTVNSQMVRTATEISEHAARTIADAADAARVAEDYVRIPESAMRALEAVQRAAEQLSDLSVKFNPPSW